MPQKCPISNNNTYHIHVISVKFVHSLTNPLFLFRSNQVFEGIPHPFDKMKRQVVPGALRTLRLRPGRKFCRLGDLSTQVGWKHNDLIAKLEAKRKEKSAVQYTGRKALTQLRAKAAANVASKIGEIDAQLVKLGNILPSAPAKKATA